MRPPRERQLRHCVRRLCHQRPFAPNLNRFARNRVTSTASRATARSSHLSPPPARSITFAALTVTASKQARIAFWLVICATSSMSPLPKPYQESITQSWPTATFTPAAITLARGSCRVAWGMGRDEPFIDFVQLLFTHSFVSSVSYQPRSSP